MATRAEVYEQIDRERMYQEDKLRAGDSGKHEVAGWIIIMQHCLDKARLAWVKHDWVHDRQTGKTSHDVDLREIRQVVATGVACLEQHGCPGRGEWRYKQEPKDTPKPQDAKLSDMVKERCDAADSPDKRVELAVFMGGLRWTSRDGVWYSDPCVGAGPWAAMYRIETSAPGSFTASTRWKNAGAVTTVWVVIHQDVPTVTEAAALCYKDSLGRTQAVTCTNDATGVMPLANLIDPSDEVTIVGWKWRMLPGPGWKTQVADPISHKATVYSIHVDGHGKFVARVKRLAAAAKAQPDWVTLPGEHVTLAAAAAACREDYEPVIKGLAASLQGEWDGNIHLCGWPWRRRDGCEWLTTYKVGQREWVYRIVVGNTGRYRAYFRIDAGATNELTDWSPVGEASLNTMTDAVLACIDHSEKQ